MRFVERDVIHVPFAANVINGRMVSVGDTLGVCQLTTTGASATHHMTTVLGMPGCDRYDEAPKLGTQSWAQGDKLYWDATNHRFTTVSTSNKLAGVARVLAATADTVGSVILTPIVQD